METSQFYLFPVVDSEFVPDTEEKCFLLFHRLAELTLELIDERPELAYGIVWTVWETPTT